MLRRSRRVLIFLSTTVCVLFLLLFLPFFLEMSLVPSIFLLQLPFYLCLWRVRRTFSSSRWCFLPCDHGLDFLHQLIYVRIQSINSINLVWSAGTRRWTLTNTNTNTSFFKFSFSCCIGMYWYMLYILFVTQLPSWADGLCFLLGVFLV